MLWGRLDPPYDRARDQIVLIHIRKTAGTALAQVLRPALDSPGAPVTRWGSVARAERGALALHGPARRFLINAAERAENLGRRLTGRPVRPPLADQAFIAGHHVLGEDPPSHRRKLYLTVVRDPVDRFVSDFHFMKGKRDRARGDATDPALYDLDLPGFVAALEARPQVHLHDYQCRQLAGAPDAEAAIRTVDDRIWLAAALPQLDRLLERIGRTLGRPLPPAPVVRRTPGRPRPEAIPADLRARIAALNPGDVRLVAHVAAAFDDL